MDICFRGLKESNKTRFDSFSVKNKWSYPILPFGIVACTAFATTFLEIAIYVCYRVFVDIFSLSLSLNFIVCHYFTCHFKIWNDDVLLKAMLLACIFFPWQDLAEGFFYLIKAEHAEAWSATF